MKKQLLYRKVVMQLFYSLCLLLLCSNISWGQQNIGSYPIMDGGFEGQTISTVPDYDAASVTAVATTFWTKSTGSGTTSISNTGSGVTGPRSGSKYAIGNCTSGSLSRVLQSPPVATGWPTGAYIVQYYTRNLTNSAGAALQALTAGIGPTGSGYVGDGKNATSTWTKVAQAVTSSATSATNSVASIGRVKLIFTAPTTTGSASYDIDDVVVYAGTVADIVAPVAASAGVRSGTNVSWTASSDVDGGGYMVVRYSTNPNTNNDPNDNGIYAVGNTITNGTGSLVGTVVYVGTGTSFTDAGSGGSTDYYKIYAVDKAFNYATETIATAVVSTTPTITSSTETLTGFNYTGVGPSTSQSFVVSGSNLTNTLVVSTTSTDFELSSNNFATAGAATINLSGATVAPTTISVRLKSGLSGGLKTATVSISSSGANVLPAIALSGSVQAVYYYNGSGLLSSNTSWGANSNGSGSNPTAVTDSYTNFVFANGSASTNASWTLGSNSKLIVGNGAAVTLTVADTFPIIGTIDAAANGSILWQDVLTSPTFGVLDDASEVHLQPAANATYALGVGTAYGKLFIDGVGIVTVSTTSTPTVKTSLSVPVGSFLSFPTSSTPTVTINAGATATINGTIKTSKAAGLFAITGSIPLNASATLILGAASTIEFNRSNVAQMVTTLPSGVNYANLILSETGSTTTASKTIAGAITVNGTLTTNLLGFSSTITGAGSITLASGATIVRTAGSLDAAPTFAGTVNVTYNGTGATQMVGSTTLSSPNVTLTTSNAAIAVGNTVTGAGVLAGTTVASITGAALVLSQNATATAAAVTFTIGTTVGQTTGVELPTAASSALNNLTINNPAGVTMNASSDVTVSGTLTFTSGNLTIGSNTLTLNGAVVNTSGTLTGSSTSNLTVGGTAGTLNFTSGSRALNNLSLGASGVATLGSALDIYGVLGFTAGGSLNMNAQAVTLKSTSTATARVSNLTGSTLSGATNVTVERYIPNRRAWRALTSPVIGSSNNSVFYNWQNNGSTIANTGVELWGPGGDTSPSSSNTGLKVGPNSSMLQYVSGTWSGVTDTNATKLFTTNGNNAFMVFPTGPYNSGLISSAATPLATTLKATGQLITGNVPYTNLPSASHTLIGNPYASPLNLISMLTDTANLGFTGYIWVWDANTSGANAVGSYNLFNVVSGVGTYTNLFTNLTAAFDSGTQIQSGQAFFVLPTVNLSTFTIKETHKGSTFSNAVLRTAGLELLRVGLYKQVNTEWSGRDGAMTVITPDADANQMANKMANGSENVAFTKNAGLFASNHHLPLVASDVLNVKVWNTTAGTNYKLKIYTEEFTATNLDATLEDVFTNARTPLTLDGTAVEYPFSVTTDALSTGNRFRIVFQTSALGVNNPTANGFSIIPNPVTGDTFQVNLGSLATGSYSYTICNTIGQEVEKGTFNNAAQNTNYEVKMSNSATGIYIMKIKGSDNSVFTAKIIKK